MQSRFWLLAALLTASALQCAGAQGPPSLPPPPAPPTTSESSTAPESGTPASYDVVSIHEHAADDHSMMWRINPDGFTNANVQLYNLASSAYSIKLDLVSGGPSWVYTKGFDTSAKLLPGEDGKPVQITSDKRNALLRALLADRFHLQAHVETRILPTYDLVVVKGGVRMKASPPRSKENTSGEPADKDMKPRGGMSLGPGHLVADDYPASNLAQQLGYIVGKTVNNKTDLTGNYSFILDYTPDDQLSRGSDAATSGTDVKPDIFTALQEQLGLKLVPSKGPVRTLVIDHAELPTAN